MDRLNHALQDEQYAPFNSVYMAATFRPSPH